MIDLGVYIERMLDIINANRADEKKAAILVRRLTTQALQEESLLLSCVRTVTASIESAGTRWSNPPLYVAEDRSVSIRIFYWPAGYGNDPHLHRAWTVTGVLHNEIVAETYRQPFLSDQTSLGSSESFVAHAGDTGVLLPPCVHRLYNPSKVDSATWHVFAAETHGAATSDAPKETIHNASAMGKRSSMRDRALGVMCEMLALMKQEGAVDLLSRIFALGGLKLKLQAVKALAVHDVKLAYLKSRELEASVEGQDKGTLSRINARLASALTTH
jgi:predicted metal-dependent enzyme (double-stranded beta helix superfamily)